MISHRALKLTDSLTLAISAKAKAMKKEGIDVISFGAGEPDFQTPENIKKAAIKAIQDNFSYYTPVSGITELKKVVIDKFRNDNQINYNINEIIITNGGKQALFNLMQVLLNKDDEVIIPIPYWVSYPQMVDVANGKSVFVDSDIKLKAKDIENAITDKTKIIMINSPSNPSGAVIDEEELRKISDLAIKNNIYVASDEVYEKLIFEGKHVSIASFNENIKKLTITINSISKTYAMTGWRIGYCGGDAEIISAMGKLQSHSTSNPCSISQKAAVEAVKSPLNENMKKEFNRRRIYMLKRLKEIGLECPKPEGAFYCFPKIKKYGSLEFCKKLLEEEKVAAVPGIAFGCDDRMRLSYATSMDNITKGLDRIERFVKKLN